MSNEINIGRLFKEPATLKEAQLCTFIFLKKVNKDVEDHPEIKTEFR